MRFSVATLVAFFAAISLTVAAPAPEPVAEPVSHHEVHVLASLTTLLGDCRLLPRQLPGYLVKAEKQWAL